MAYFGNEPAKVAVKVGSGVITATELADDSITTADIIADAIKQPKSLQMKEVKEAERPLVDDTTNVYS